MVHSVRAGRHLATKLNILVQQHFDLASTTITNIPMKVNSSFFPAILKALFCFLNIRLICIIYFN